MAALAVASGAAAITLTIQALAQAGAHVVAQKTIYGGTYNLLEHTLAAFGIETTFVDAHNLDEVLRRFVPTPRWSTWRRSAIPIPIFQTSTLSLRSPMTAGCPWWSITRSARRICSVLLSTERI